MATHGNGRHFPRMVLMVSGDFISRLIGTDLSTNEERGYLSSSVVKERVENNPLDTLISFKKTLYFGSFPRLFRVILSPLMS